MGEREEYIHPRLVSRDRTSHQLLNIGRRPSQLFIFIQDISRVSA